MSKMQPSLDTPSPNIKSNSACLNGGATLFFTTLTLTLLPTASAPSLIHSVRLISSLTEAQNFNALPPGVVSGLPNITPIFSRN